MTLDVVHVHVHVHVHALTLVRGPGQNLPAVIAHVTHVITQKPLALATLAVLVLAVILAAALSIVIARREAPARSSTARRRQTRASSTPTPVRSGRVVVTPDGALDMQQRLRRLTSSHELAAEDAELTAGAQRRVASPAPATPRDPVPATAVAPDAPRPVAMQALPVPSAQAHGIVADTGPDATQFFGDEVKDVEPDATRFFADADSDATRDDATHFFGQTTPDATAFFGEEPVHAQPAEGDDATRFFAGADDPGARPGAPALPPPAETRFFAPADLDVAAPASLAPEASEHAPLGTTAMPALPPASNAATWNTEGGTAPALDTGGLNGVRARLASVTMPEVLALSVMDSSGRVLAGETDQDLTGELRSLMAESGQGNTADLEQPVVLDDEAPGAILLFPTGANALLGALVSDADDPRATRARLRSVAREIGDVIRSAS